ncbi:integral membrane protein [Whalleya microplaca]|nr:integral membrane protein [Whalleya microplaca]
MSSQLPSSGLQNAGIALEIAFPSIAFFTILLRLYVRITSNNVGWDDILVCIAMVFSIALAITSITVMRLEFIGIHAWNIPHDADFVEALKWAYAMGTVYNPILALVKISVLVFILRFAGVISLVRYIIWSTIAFITALMIAIIFVVIFQCKPVDQAWDPAHPHCINSRIFMLTTSGLSVLTDLLALVLPFCVFTYLRMSTRRKLSLMAVFGLGFIVTAVSCVRMYYLNKAFINPGPDGSYSITFTFSAIEVNLAIIGASAPALWPLIHGRLGTKTEVSASPSHLQKYIGSRSGWMRTNDAGSSNPSHVDDNIDLNYMDARGIRTEFDREYYPGPQYPQRGIVKTTQFDLEVIRTDRGYLG